jgi:hypothetical protein
MLDQRLQILVTSDQRRRLEHEARRRGTSVGRVVRDAVDAQLGGVTQEERRAALEEIRAMRGRYLPPEEINRIVAEEREEDLDEMLRQLKR